jgi:N-acetylglutamate synthase-like GNAT family acetyltransferase
LFTTDAVQREYPWTDNINEREIVFRLMSAADRGAMLKFTQHLPESDLMWLRMDITKPAIVGQWVDNIEQGSTITVLALEGAAVVGYASIHHNRQMWMRHLGEMRMLVRDDFRADSALEQRLVNEVFQLANEMGLYRVFIHIPTDQPHVRVLYEQLGFQPEALLTDWLMTEDGKLHDLIIMSHHLKESH